MAPCCKPSTGHSNKSIFWHIRAPLVALRKLSKDSKSLSNVNQKYLPILSFKLPQNMGSYRST